MNDKQLDKLIKAQAETNKLLSSVDVSLKQLVKQTKPQPERVVVERPQSPFIGRR